MESGAPRLLNSALEKTRATRPNLSKSEGKVADLILANPARILDSSLAEVAELAGVSQPTVIRFCVAVGFSGYQEFKLRLAQNLALGRSATHSVISDSDALDAVADKIFEYTMTSLDWARQHLDRAALERAVDELARARSITFFGFGASAIVAMDAQQKFPLFDVPSRAEADAHQQIMAASMMRGGDALVVISNTGRTRQIVEAAEIAKSAGATVIGVVGAAGPISALCDVTLLGGDFGQHQRLYADHVPHRRARDDRHSLNRRRASAGRRSPCAAQPHEAPAQCLSLRRNGPVRLTAPAI